MSVVLSEHLPLLTTAPDGIQKLRGLILQLAVMGKLVPQDPNDEPASELLKRISQERARLVAEGVCKKSKAMPFSGDEPTPYDVPFGWSWVRLAEIGHDWGQKTPDSNFTYVDVSAIDNARGVVDSPSVQAPDNAPSRARKIVRRGTVIYSTIRPYLLNIAIIDRDLTPAPIASTAFAVIHPVAGLSSRYIFWYLRSPVFVHYVESVQTGIAYPAINDSQFFSGLFPLPPVAEQHRIVAKVDELMALCDRLEAEQADDEAAHARLVDSLLGTLIQSTGAADLAANWQRLAEHFDTIFTTESSLDALKQTILQLAVMGKLVPQDPNDEPASELLKLIAKERTRLEVEGICKKSKALPPVGEDEQPFTLPVNWKWVRLGDLSEAITSGSRDWAQHYSAAGAIFVRMGNLSRGSYELRLNNIQHVKVPSDGEGTRTRLQAADLLLSITGEVGLLGLIPDGFGEAYINQHTCMIRTFSIIRGRFIPEVLRSPLALAQYDEPQRGIKNSFRLTDVAELMIPLPPLAEQQRIVAKVDQLMALCDRLKADLAESRSRQARLASTLIESTLQTT